MSDAGRAASGLTPGNAFLRTLAGVLVIGAGLLTLTGAPILLRTTDGRLPGGRVDCGRLTLALDIVVPAAFTAPPAQVIALTDSTFLGLDQAGSLRGVGVPATFEGLDPAQVQSGLAMTGGWALVHSARTLHRLRVGRWERLELPAGLDDIRSISGGRQTATLWVVNGEERLRTIHRLEAEGENAFRETGAWELPGSWRLVAVDLGAALAISTRLPFEVRRIEGDGEWRRLGALGDDDRHPTWPDSAAPYVSGVAGLDCGAVLVTVADLRSSARGLLVVDDETGAVLRATGIDTSMGFFDSSRPDRRLFAFRATREGGEMLVYRWEWVAEEVDDPNSKRGG